MVIPRVWIIRTIITAEGRMKHLTKTIMVQNNIHQWEKTTSANRNSTEEVGLAQIEIGVHLLKPQNTGNSTDQEAENHSLTEASSVGAGVEGYPIILAIGVEVEETNHSPEITIISKSLALTN